MNKKVIGYVIAALVIGSMVVIMINNTVKKPEPVDTSGVIVDKQDEGSSDVSEAETGIEQGNLPPDFELTTLAGEQVKLSELKGKKVVLNFWATWCPPCKAEMPHMENYYNNNKDKENVEILAVNLTNSEKGEKDVQNFIDAYNITFPIPLDEKGIVGETYQAFQIPTTYMLNTDGTIAHKIIGPMDEAIMEQLVQDLD